MEERREIILKYTDRGMKVSKAVQLAGMSRSSYYYLSRHGNPGKKPSTSSQMMNGKELSNEEIIFLITELLKLDFVDYGYIKVTHWLNQLGVIINKKKVYRLMRENGLLNRFQKKSPARNFVKFTKALPSRPFEILEMDIKYIYVHGTGQNALLLSVIDTFTRKNLAWLCKYSIKKNDVKVLIDNLVLNHLQDYDLVNQDIIVTIRSDNGSQFISRMVREYLRDNFIIQEFTRPATPQQNGHIESFHSIISRLVSEKFEFEGLKHLNQILEAFFDFYNNRRIHSGICYLTPDIFQWAWENDLVEVNQNEKNIHKRVMLKNLPVNIVYKYNLTKFGKSSEAETGSAGEQPVRNSLMDLNNEGEFPLPLNFKRLFLSNMPKKT